MKEIQNTKIFKWYLFFQIQRHNRHWEGCLVATWASIATWGSWQLVATLPASATREEKKKVSWCHKTQDPGSTASNTILFCATVPIILTIYILSHIVFVSVKRSRLLEHSPLQMVVVDSDEVAIQKQSPVDMSDDSDSQVRHIIMFGDVRART